MQYLEMTSGFKSGRQEDFGSGGKILRGNRFIKRFSPYRRPSSSVSPLPLPPPESQQTNKRPSWLQGVISGAGKLISSVLGSECSSSSTSECSSGSSDGDYDYSPGFALLGSLLAIVPTNERKLVIQQLLMQETFKRDECNKMIEVIQSRVVDFPYSSVDDQIGNDIQERVSSNGYWHSLDMSRNLSRRSYYSPGDRSSFSPKFFSNEAVSADLHNKAIMEAKKRFEEKKQLPSSAYDQECGPCVLNTDMNQYDSHALASAAWKNYGDSFLESEIVQPLTVAPAKRSIQKDSVGQGKIQANDCLHVNIYSTSGHAHTISDLETLDKISHIQEGASGSAKNNWHLTNANNRKSVFELTSKRNHELTSDVFIDIPSIQGVSLPQNSAKMKPFNQMQTELAGPSKGKRRIKKVVSQKKWRG